MPFINFDILCSLGLVWSRLDNSSAAIPAARIGLGEALRLLILSQTKHLPRKNVVLALSVIEEQPLLWTVGSATVLSLSMCLVTWGVTWWKIGCLTNLERKAGSFLTPPWTCVLVLVLMFSGKIAFSRTRVSELAGNRGGRIGCLLVLRRVLQFQLMISRVLAFSALVAENLFWPLRRNSYMTVHYTWLCKFSGIF